MIALILKILGGPLVAWIVSLFNPPAEVRVKKAIGEGNEDARKVQDSRGNFDSVGTDAH